MLKQFVEFLGLLLFKRRKFFLGVFVLLTVLLGASASRLQVDAGFEKMIPLEHEYMKTFMAYRNTFGGANRVLVALRQHEGDIYNAGFMQKLKSATDEVFFIPGVDRATVTSLFTPTYVSSRWSKPVLPVATSSRRTSRARRRISRPCVRTCSSPVASAAWCPTITARR